MTSEPDLFAPEQGPPPREREGGRVVLLMLLGLLLLLGLGYAALSYAAGDKVPRGTTISGVDVGGRTRDQAADALREGLASAEARPIEASVGSEDVTVVPAEAGLSVDIDASLDAAGPGTGWSPDWLWRYFTGGEDLEAVVDVDEPTMTAYLDELSGELGRPARDGSVTFHGTQVRVRQALSGSHIDADAARQALADGYLHEAPVVLPVVDELPDIDQADVRAAVDDFANPAVSGPVTLRFGKTKVVLGPAEFTAALSLKPVDGELVPTADPKIVSALVDQSISGDGAPVDATVALVGGKPKVIPAKPGVAYKPADVADALVELAGRPAGKREGTVPSSVARADFTTRDARKLGIKEKVSTFTTYYPYAEYRNVNIGRAAELVNGTVLKPGTPSRSTTSSASAPVRTASPRASSSATASSRRTWAAASRRWPPPRSTPCSSPGSRTSSTSRTRSTSTATRSAARPPWPGVPSTYGSRTTPLTACSSTRTSPRPRRRRRAWSRSPCGRRSTGTSPPRPATATTSPSPPPAR
ncbi:MAG: peptidoglycan binding domain-containing protein [Nocardioides sp.]